MNDGTRLNHLRDRIELQCSVERQGKIEDLQKELELATQKDELLDGLPFVLKMYDLGETCNRTFTK